MLVVLASAPAAAQIDLTGSWAVRTHDDLEGELLGDYGKHILLGVRDLSSMVVETPETVAPRIRRALPYVGADRIIVAPDCGMKYLPRPVADGKMRAMVAGAALMRREVCA